MRERGVDGKDIQPNNVTLSGGSGPQIDVDGGDLVIRDSNGNIVLRYDEATTTWDFQDESVTIDDLGIGSADLVSTGDFLGVGPSYNSYKLDGFATTSTTYTSDTSYFVGFVQWDQWLPSGAQGSAISTGQLITSTGDYRFRNFDDSETIQEVTDSNARFAVGPTNYTPTTTGSVITIRPEVRTNDGGTATSLRGWTAGLGVQV